MGTADLSTGVDIKLEIEKQRMALIQELMIDEHTTKRSLALYRERLNLLDTRNPALALVAMAEVAEYPRYRAHFLKKISLFTDDLRLTGLKLALARMQQRWGEMDECQQTASFLTDEMGTLRCIIEEELSSDSSTDY